VPRRQPPDGLISAAKRGELRRSNTMPGTKGRQAVDAVVYRQRAADRAVGETARQRLGVVRTGREMSVLFDGPPRFEVVSDVTRAEARRLARYDSLLGQLAGGTLSPTAFDRRVSSWRPFRGEHFLSEPDAALAILELRRAGDEPIFHYERGRRP
jgi:hypothetical protein